VGAGTQAFTGRLAGEGLRVASRLASPG